ncbi:hypothetical protein BaRGS_00000399, partial [Batillaria attramentaria]
VVIPLTVALFPLLLLPPAAAFGTGPPLDACATMFPVGHGFDAQLVPPPYELSVSTTQVTLGSTVTVTLKVKDGFGQEYFEGIFVQARLASCESVTPVGTFSIPQHEFLKLLSCGGVSSWPRHHSLVPFLRLFIKPSNMRRQWGFKSSVCVKTQEVVNREKKAKKKSQSELNLQTQQRCGSWAEFPTDFSDIHMDCSTSWASPTATVVKEKNIFWTNVFSPYIGDPSLGGYGGISRCKVVTKRERAATVMGSASSSSATSSLIFVAVVTANGLARFF